MTLLGGCRCGGPAVSGRYADVVIVQTGSTGREVLLRDATVALQPVFMGETGEQAVPLRNLGLEAGRIETITRLEGDEGLTVTHEGELEPNEDGALTVRFVAPQAADVGEPRTTHRARFSMQVNGARPGEEELDRKSVV